MARTTSKLTMRFSEQDYTAMQELAAQRDCSMAQIVRDALKVHLSALKTLNEAKTDVRN